MNAVISLVMVIVLVAIAWIGVAVGLEPLFGMVLPYAALLIFVVGFIAKIVGWAKAPVPFRIPTTSGQQASLPWVKQAKLDNPATGKQTFGRMVLEVLFFRSLFKNTKAEMRSGPRLLYGDTKWLWLFAILFHYAFFIVLIRHLRFFLDPVPGFVVALESLDAFFQVTVPALFLTDILLIAALGYLLLRRFTNAQVRVISRAPDYFPLFLLLGVAISGVIMRYFAKTDVVGMKELATGLVSLRFFVPEGIGAVAYIHLFLVTVLFAYFPFSKLMHAGGVFMSPTRNLANNNRAVRHVNPWNRPVHPHKFEDWEREFADEIAEAGYKLERD
jgi:nitrate reductase gamma subunit